MQPLDEEPAAELVLEQRLSPWRVIRTTVKDHGLLIQVARPFTERVHAVGFERLLLEPAHICYVRADRLWTAAGLAAAGLVATWPGLSELLAWAAPGEAGSALAPLLPLLGPGLLAASVLLLLLAVADPRRLSVFLDREQAHHPKFVRGRADEEQVEAFVQAVRQAIVDYRCSGPSSGEEVEEQGEAEEERRHPVRHSLADTLDALLVMRQDGLLDEHQLESFKEFAERR